MTLIAHAAGSLGLAHRLVVATHALRCPVCRRNLRTAELAAGVMLDRLEQTALQPDALQACLAKLDAPASPPLPASSTTRKPAGELGDLVLPTELRELWLEKMRWLAPGLRHATLYSDERGTLHAVRVEPNMALPQHTHRGLELTCVLEGAFHDDSGPYSVADVCEGDETETDDDGHDHLVVADPPGACVCIIATTGRMQFKGWMARLLQPLMPF